MNDLRPALFMDRDGTVIVEVDHCCRPEDVALYPGVKEAMQRARDAGYKLVFITNQSGIGRGYFTEADFHAVNGRIRELLGHAAPDGIYFAPDLPGAATPRRKPGTGMIEEACRDLGITLEGSWMIGDKWSDIQCGTHAGLPAILVETGYGQGEAHKCAPDSIQKDLAAAIAWVLSGAPPDTAFAGSEPTD